MKKSPRITTNEGPPDKKVNIEVDVVQHPDSTYPVVIEPYKVDLSQFSEKKVDEREFEIANVSDKDLDLTMIAFPEHLMKVDLPDQVGAGETVTGKVTLKDEALKDSFEKSFTFELNDENGTRFTVPVKRTLRTSSKGITEAKAEKGK
jgi:hypothetical protein